MQNTKGKMKDFEKLILPPRFWLDREPGSRIWDWEKSGSGTWDPRSAITVQDLQQWQLGCARSLAVSHLNFET